jgi:Ribbon-helix-helix protein, copG family
LKHLDIKYVRHHDVSVRTTLTLDDDLARRLQALAREQRRSFKEVTNDAIRRGLSTGDAQVEGVKRFRVRPKSCGFRSGVDPLKLNQIYDDLEMSDPESGRLEVHEP